MMKQETQRTHPIPLRMDRDLRLRVTRAAARLGTTRSAIVRMALLHHLDDIDVGVLRLRAEANVNTQD